MEHSDFVEAVEQEGNIFSSEADDVLEIPELLQCPICQMEFSNANSLQVHVDGHFTSMKPLTKPVKPASKQLTTLRKFLQ